MKRRLLYKPAAERTLSRMASSDAKRIIDALEAFADSGQGDIKALKGKLKGLYRLRVGKWRAFLVLDDASTVLVAEIDNRGQAY